MTVFSSRLYSSRFYCLLNDHIIYYCYCFSFRWWYFRGNYQATSVFFSLESCLWHGWLILSLIWLSSCSILRCLNIFFCSRKSKQINLEPAYPYMLTLRIILFIKIVHIFYDFRQLDFPAAAAYLQSSKQAWPVADWSQFAHLPGTRLHALE